MKTKKWMVACPDCLGGEAGWHCSTCCDTGLVQKICPYCERPMEKGDGFCEDCDSCYECGHCDCPVCEVCGEREGGQEFELVTGEKVCERCYNEDVATQRQVLREAYEETRADETRALARHRGEL